MVRRKIAVSIDNAPIQGCGEMYTNLAAKPEYILQLTKLVA